jgi:ribosome biogenesis GTPase
MPIEEGIVFKSTGSWYTVKTKSGNFLSCKIKGKLRIEGYKSTNPVAVGDKIKVELIDNESGVITELLDRKNYIIRKSINLSKQTHIIAANIDQAFIMVTLVLPETPPEFVDRFLAVAEAYNIPSKIILNKTDLYTEEFTELKNFWKSVYSAANYEIIEISVNKGLNIEEVKQMLHNKTTLIAGNSGVGKSSLIQKLIPESSIKIGEISEYHLSGKHTTTFAEMYELPFGGSVIDTPGIKGFGLYDTDKHEVSHYFPEIFNVSENCQFYNCLHVNEPNCAVIKAVEEGSIHWSRYRSYLSILEDSKSKYRQ